LEEKQTDHAISSGVTTTKLPLCFFLPEKKIEEEQQQKGETHFFFVVFFFFENKSTFEILIFWLSYCT